MEGIARRGLMLVLSSPSGAGKTTLARRLLDDERDGIAISISHTTRPRRKGEKDGRDYHFVDHDTFARMRDHGEFLEWAVVFDNYYGTTRQPVEQALAQGRDAAARVEHALVAGQRQSLEHGRAPAAEAHVVLGRGRQHERAQRRRATRQQRALRKETRAVGPDLALVPQRGGAAVGSLDGDLAAEQIRIAAPHEVALVRGPERARERELNGARQAAAAVELRAQRTGRLDQDFDAIEAGRTEARELTLAARAHAVHAAHQLRVDQHRLEVIFGTGEMQRAVEVGAPAQRDRRAQALDAQAPQLQVEVVRRGRPVLHVAGACDDAGQTLADGGQPIEGEAAIGQLGDQLARDGVLAQRPQLEVPRRRRQRSAHGLRLSALGRREQHREGTQSRPAGERGHGHSRRSDGPRAGEGRRYGQRGAVRPTAVSINAVPVAARGSGPREP